MKLEQALAAFPARSVYRRLLPDLMSRRARVREEANDRLNELDEVGPDEDPLATTWKHSEKEALALLRAAVSLRFPPSKYDWEDVAHDLFFPLVRSPHPSLLPIAVEAYPRVSDRAKNGLLALMGAIGTRESAAALMGCLREHGWPDGVYGRVFTEMEKLLDHADVLFPDLLRLSGPCVGEVADLLTAGLAAGKIDLAAGKIDLGPISPLAVRRLKATLKRAAGLQRDEGIAWRFTEKYGSVREEAGSWLDIAGYLWSPALDPLLGQALGLRDPRLLAFACAAVLRRGGKVGKAVLGRVAASHETRGLLFELLRGLGRLDLFPSRWRTWDAFAAANMVGWLLYPTELGREPDRLEKKAVLTSGKATLYVWRFRCEDGPWYAGVSGPYQLGGEPGPLHGSLTFSRFDEWDTATAEGHAEAVLETLAEWGRGEG